VIGSNLTNQDYEALCACIGPGRFLEGAASFTWQFH
jgi:hypothetical protein